jgi:sirohydrochlorin ferrochelatase
MIFLVDNGSVRPEAYKNLCTIAAQLSGMLGEKIRPAPLLHADKIPAKELGGTAARTIEDCIKEAYDSGQRKFEILPLFFGPSGALVDYFPRRLNILSKNRQNFAVRILNPLFKDEKDGGDLLTDILEDRVMELANQLRLESFTVLLVDHGSPKKEVTEVRNILATRLGERLNALGIHVLPASMERRSGDEYAFNEPLLEFILNREVYANKNVVIAQLFLSPGRHAGPNGDIAGICAKAERDNVGLKTYRTDLIGNHPKLIDLLSRRWHERESLRWLTF